LRTDDAGEKSLGDIRAKRREDAKGTLRFSTKGGKKLKRGENWNILLRKRDPSIGKWGKLIKQTNGQSLFHERGGAPRKVSYQSYN